MREVGILNAQLLCRISGDLSMIPSSAILCPSFVNLKSFSTSTIAEFVLL